MKVDYLIGDKAMNNIISHHEAVQWAVKVNTEEIAAKAEGRLALHRETGEARIETSYGETDGFVSLVDPAAESIEFGHWVKNQHGQTDKYVDGLRIISKAAGII